MIGTQIGRYRIDGELGRGGMGVVYRGTQVTLDRTVAIKMLPAHLADGDNRARFRREALTLARLAHPNIVHIYDVEDQDGDSFIMMEHVGGGSLADRIASGSPLPAMRCAEIMVPILSALHAAHLAGVVHRDIKPDNILFTDEGRPKLTDFGVAHMRDAGSKTRTGVMLGTPYYMSPEQAQGRRVTAATDLYAVGVVLYEMLSGQVPFTGTDPLSVALKHVQEAPRPLATFRPDLDPALCALVHRALAKDPATRFTSAAAMQDALEAGAWAPSRTLDPGSSGSHAAVPPPIPASVDPPARENTRSWTPPEPASTPEAADSAVRTSLAALETTKRHLGDWLQRPGWRGLPISFWAGAVAIALGLVWIGADAMRAPRGQAAVDPGTDTPSGPPSPPSSDPSRAIAPSTRGGGGVSRRSPIAGSTRPGSQARPTLTAEERAALARLASGGADPQPIDSLPILDRIASDQGPDGPVSVDDLIADDVASDDEPTAPSAASNREQVRALVDRQFRAVRRADRALFLSDFRADVRARAASEFDQANAGATNIRSTISNLSIEFPDSEHAHVTFDVDVTFTVRADGSTVTDSFEEAWDVVREGDRWWITAWK